MPATPARAMIEGDYQTVLESADVAAFRAAIIGFGQRLGFQTVSAMMVFEPVPGEPQFRSVDNTPAAFAEAYSDPSLGSVDPVMQHCKHTAVPIVWDQDTYVAQGRGPVWEQQARFGYRHGIALAIHLPDRRHFFLGVDRDQALPRRRSTVTRLVADLQLFAVHAQDAAFRLVAPPPPPADMPALTPREAEALRWTMAGKTAWEAGAIMNISERTAVLHLQNAMRKLDCVNKHQAVLKALRLGLIR